MRKAATWIMEDNDNVSSNCCHGVELSAKILVLGWHYHASFYCEINSLSFLM